MNYFIVILVALVSLSNGQRYKDPRQFPANCPVPSAGTAPEVHAYTFSFTGPTGGKPATIHACVAVGQACKKDQDCPKPDLKACQAKDSGYKGNIVLVKPQCVAGACRATIQDENQPCDCVLGCNSYNKGSVPLSCTIGTCLPPPCAPCGEAPNGRRCCGSGVKGHDGKCLCASYGG